VSNAGRRLKDAAYDLEQRRFSAPVLADDPDELSLFDTERDVLQCMKRMVVGFSERMKGLFYAIHTPVEKLVRLGYIFETERRLLFFRRFLHDRYRSI